MNSVLHFYTFFIRITSNLQSPFLLVVRLFWGFCFFSAGLGKLLDINQVIVFFTTLDIPFPVYSAYLVAITELIGGAFLFIGLLSRVTTIPLITIMIVAYFTAEADAIRLFFADPINFITRTPFTFLLASLFILVFGPGKFSIDYILKKRFLRKKS
ncbi:MAG: DoxX family protein [Chlamydiae bacterium]|nr:DoxX family protein [Chlamydiota bacterium]